MMAPFGVLDKDTGEDALVCHLDRASRGPAALVGRRTARAAPVAAGPPVGRHRPDGEVLRARAAAGPEQPPARRAAPGGAPRRPDRSASHGRCARGRGRLRQAVRAHPGAVAARHPGMASRRHGGWRGGHGPGAAGRRVWLEREPGPAARVAAHGHRLHDAEPAGKRQRVDCRDVGQVAGPRFAGVGSRLADRHRDPGPGDRGLAAQAGSVRARIPRVRAADAPRPPASRRRVGITCCCSPRRPSCASWTAGAS